jgi:hypothetical protein
MARPPYPASLDAIDAAWLSAALAERYPGVRVDEARPTTKIGGTATKIRIELTFKPPAGQAGAPASLWAKAGFEGRGAHQGDAFANEVHFFRDLAPTLPANPPLSYYGDIDPATGNGIVLLEDLLLRRAEFATAATQLRLDEVVAVLELQARYHAFLWRSPRLFELPWLRTGGVMAETRMVDQYFELWDRSVELPRFAAVPPALRERRLVQRCVAQLIDDLSAEPTCLVHGDSHTANLFFEPDGSVGYLDWQHVMRGSWAFDLANFLITALPVELRREHERDLLSTYLERLSVLGADAPQFDDAWDTYRRYAAWTFMWVLCPPDVHPEALCARNTERACAAIEDLETVRALGTV